MEIRSNPPKATKTTPIKKAYKEHKKQPFLDAYSEYGTIWRAAKEVGVSRDAVHDWRRNDSNFSITFEASSLENTERLEQTAISRALAGDVALLIFLLKSRNPERYSERYQKRALIEAVEQLVSGFVSSVNRVVPEICYSCRISLDIRKKLSEDFLQRADRLQQKLAQ